MGPNLQLLPGSEEQIKASHFCCLITGSIGGGSSRRVVAECTNSADKVHCCRRRQPALVRGEDFPFPTAF